MVVGGHALLSVSKRYRTTLVQLLLSSFNPYTYNVWLNKAFQWKIWKPVGHICWKSICGSFTMLNLQKIRNMAYNPSGKNQENQKLGTPNVGVEKCLKRKVCIYRRSFLKVRMAKKLVRLFQLAWVILNVFSLTHLTFPLPFILQVLYWCI